MMMHFCFVRMLAWTERNIKIVFSLFFVSFISSVLLLLNASLMFDYLFGFTLILGVILSVNLIMDFTYCKLNDYLIVNRWTGTLNMRSDINNNYLNQYRKELKLPRDEYLAKMFLAGIKSIKNIPTIMVPFVLWRTKLSVKTNETIYIHIRNKGYDHTVVGITSKPFIERMHLMSWKLLMGIMKYKEGTKDKYKKLHDLVNEEANIYSIEISLNSLRRK